ncbi:MAG: hypothetical protein ACE5IJ_11500 [Thermoplasmata archaeon]
MSRNDDERQEIANRPAESDRRKFLRLMGLGVGVVALRGLSACEAFTDIGAESDQLPLRPGPRFAHVPMPLPVQLDQALLDELKRQGAQALRIWAGGDTEAGVSKGRKALGRLYDHYDQTGLTAIVGSNETAFLEDYPGVVSEVRTQLRSMGLTSAQIDEQHVLSLQARDILLGQGSPQATPIMNSAVSAVTTLEQEVAGQGGFVPQSFHECVGAVLEAVATAIATAFACAACTSSPNLLTCTGCYGGILATARAVENVRDTCS